MKFLPITAKTQTIWLTSGAIVGAIALWSASMATEITVGKSGYDANGSPIVTQVNRQTRNKGVFLTISAGLIGAVVLSLSAKDKDGDRLVNPQTLTKDIGEAAKVLSNNLGCGLAFVSGAGFKWAFGKQSIARSVTLSVLPIEIRDRITAKITDKDWFSKFLDERRHYMICGSTGDGKTMLLFAIIIEYLKRSREGKDQLVICDANYGKRDGDGNLNTWMDLPRNFIKTNNDEIMNAMRSVLDILRERKDLDAQSATARSDGKDKEHKRLEAIASERGNLLIVIEEHMATRKFLTLESKDLVNEFDSIISEILLYGRGYGVKVLIVLQYLNATDNGINLGERDQMCTVVLKSMAIQENQVKKISDDPKELVNEYKEALKKNAYLAIVQFGGANPKIRKIPDLSYVSEISVKSPVDPVETWWKQNWTVDNQQWILDCLESGRSPISSAVRPEFKKRFGIEPSAKDAKYQKLKAAIEQIKSKTLTTSGA